MYTLLPETLAFPLLVYSHTCPERFSELHVEIFSLVPLEGSSRRDNGPQEI